MPSDLPPSATDPTVLMSSQPAQRPAPRPEPVRQLYVVRAAGDEWDVVDHAGAVQRHATKPEALLAARTAARARWSTLGLPSRVTLETSDGGSMLVALYGSDTPPA